MKLVSWNVNGIRACLQKGFLDSFYQLDADIFCVQETKMQSGQADLEIEGYHYYLNSAVKKGYSGTLIYSKEKPLNVFYGMNKEEHDQEGRLIRNLKIIMSLLVTLLIVKMNSNVYLIV